MTFAGDQHFAVLDHALQAHRAVHHRRQRERIVGGDAIDAEVADFLETRAVLFPPELGDTVAVGEDDDLTGAAGCFAQPAFVELADVNPEVNGAGQILQPEVGFFIRR